VPLAVQVYSEKSHEILIPRPFGCQMVEFCRIDSEEKCYVLPNIFQLTVIQDNHCFNCNDRYRYQQSS